MQIRLFDGVQEQVHGGDARHGAVGVPAGELRASELFPVFLGHVVAMMLTDPFGGGNQEAAGAAGGVGDPLAGLGVQQLDHHVADMAGCAELAVDAGGVELAEHVLVQVAHLVRRGDVTVEQFGDVMCSAKGKASSLTMWSICSAVRSLKYDQRIRWCSGSLGKMYSGGSHPQIRHLLCRSVLVVEAFHEHEVSQLADDLDGIGDAALPHMLPSGIHLGLDRASDHECALPVLVESFRGNHNKPVAPSTGIQPFPELCCCTLCDSFVATQIPDFPGISTSPGAFPRHFLSCRRNRHEGRLHIS